MVYTLRFFSSNCNLFHNFKVFGSSIIHILYIYSTNIGTEYFVYGIYSPFFSLQNAVCFIILTYLVPVLFTFYIQDVLKLKKNNSDAKRLKTCTVGDLGRKCGRPKKMLHIRGITSCRAERKEQTLPVAV